LRAVGGKVRKRRSIRMNDRLRKSDLARIAAKAGLKLTRIQFSGSIVLKGVVEDATRRFVVVVTQQRDEVDMPFGMWGVDVYEEVWVQERRKFRLSKEKRSLTTVHCLTVRLDPRDYGVKVVIGQDINTLWEVLIKFCLQEGQYKNLRNTFAEGIPYLTWMPRKEVEEIIY
jgi:hypothetical protein